MTTKLLVPPSDKLPTPPQEPVVMLPPAPRGEWKLLLSKYGTGSLWRGKPRDLPSARQASKVVAVTMQTFSRKHEPTQLYEINGEGVWVFGPLVGACYFVGTDGAVWWRDDAEPPPALPLPPPRKQRRKPKPPENDEPPPFGYEHWREQAEFCLKHLPTMPHSKERAFLNNIVDEFDELTAPQFKWLEDIFKRVRRNVIDGAPLWRTRLEAMRRRREARGEPLKPRRRLRA